MAGPGKAGARGEGERGSALVELALVVPLLGLLVFGTVETGRAWVTKTKVVSAVAQATRVAAADGNRPEADRDVLLALQASLPADALSSVDRVVVYRSSDPDGVVPTGCIKAVGDASEIGTSLCNTYSGTTLRAVSAGSMLGFGGLVGAKDVYWPPVVRHGALADPPDYVGVWVRTKNHPITRLGVGDVTITARDVMRIQPDLNG
jgi:Flp pilus assembly protein TadG